MHEGEASCQYAEVAHKQTALAPYKTVQLDGMNQEIGQSSNAVNLRSLLMLHLLDVFYVKTSQ